VLYGYRSEIVVAAVRWGWLLAQRMMAAATRPSGARSAESVERLDLNAGPAPVRGSAENGSSDS